MLLPYHYVKGPMRFTHFAGEFIEITGQSRRYAEIRMMRQFFVANNPQGHFFEKTKNLFLDIVVGECFLGL